MSTVANTRTLGWLVAEASLIVGVLWLSGCGGAPAYENANTTMTPNTTTSGGAAANPTPVSPPSVPTTIAPPPPTVAATSSPSPGREAPSNDTVVLEDTRRSIDARVGDFLAQLQSFEQQLASSGNVCRDVCRASNGICEAAFQLCELAGELDGRCSRARSACEQARRQRDGSCPVCPRE